MKIQALSSILSSAGIKISSMLMLVFFAKHMTEDDFGIFSYGFSLIVTLATFFSYVIGQTWAKLSSEHKNTRVVSPLVITAVSSSFMLPIFIAFFGGWVFEVMLLVSFSSVMAMLSYSGQFLSLYFGRFRFSLFSSGLAVLSLSSFVICLELGVLSLNLKNAFMFLALFYSLQAPCWVSLWGKLTQLNGDTVSFRWALNLSSKYSVLSLMGAPVHFLCITMLAFFSGVKDVGLFSLSFQLYVATLFFITSLQPVMLKIFSGNEISGVYKFSFLSVIVTVFSVILYFLVGGYFGCSDIAIFCLDGRVVALSFGSALLAGNNAILMQYINANTDPVTNIKLQSFYAGMYLFLSLAFIVSGGAVIGLYSAIITSSLLLLVFQILKIRRMRDESCPSDAV